VVPGPRLLPAHLPSIRVDRGRQIDNMRDPNLLDELRAGRVARAAYPDETSGTRTMTVSLDGFAEAFAQLQERIKRLHGDLL